jgi:hypothetical protein
MSDLADLWDRRLGQRERADVRDEPELVTEALGAWTPDGMRIDVLPGSELRRDPHEGLVLTLAAEFAPGDHRQSGPDHGSIERQLFLGAGVARHIRLELPGYAQQQEKGRRMLGRSVLIYEQLGITRISLAAVDVGRYVWAACGFSFTNQRDRAAVAGRLVDLETETGIKVSNLDWDSLEPYDIAYAESDDPLPLRDWLEILDEPADYHDHELDQPVTRPGKLLLLHHRTPGWDGTLKIGTAEHTFGYELMRRYTGLTR